MYKFAIIGCGETAPGHIQQIQKHGTLAAVCDIIKEKADAFAMQCQANAYYSIDEMLAKEKAIDVIAICTPTGMHAEHCIKSAQAGLHVICETPLCLTGVAAWQIMETARYCGKKIFVVNSSRHNASLQSLKKLLENEAGRLYSFQLNCFHNRPAAWYENSRRGKLFPDGGTLYAEFSNYIDALLWLAGDLKSVCGVAKNMAHESLVEFEDSGIVSIEMQNGMIGGLNWSVNTYQKNMEVSLTILAEKVSIRLGGEHMNRIEYQLRASEELHRPATPGSGPGNGSMNNYDKVYENLVNDLQDNSYTNSYDGLKTVEAIEKIYKSVAG